MATQGTTAYPYTVPFHSPMGALGTTQYIGAVCFCPPPPPTPIPPIPIPPAPGLPFTNGEFNEILTNEGDALADLASQYRTS